MASWNSIFHQYARGSRAIGLGAALALASIVVVVAPGGCALDVEGATAGGNSATTSSSTTTGASASASTTTSTGTCGGAGCTPCVADIDCGMPSFDGCTASICVASFCTPKATAGLPSTTQTPGDCMKSVCGADGKPMLEGDPNDTPADDNNVCTDELCVAGAPTKMPAALGAICPGGTCDGAGACLNCMKNGDCAVGLNPTCDMNLHTCVSCSDGLQNGTETGVDCGGNCKKCDGITCGMDVDCVSNLCVDKICCKTACAGTCQACDVAGSLGTCSSVPAGNTDPVTCADAMTMACDGAGACKAIAGKPCAADGECLSNTCLSGLCRASADSPCTDDFMCASQRCSGGKCADCAVAADCLSTMCTAPVCKAPSGAPCDVNADCAGGKCQYGLCLRDNNDVCSVGADCLSGFCTGGTCQPCVNNSSCPNSTCGPAAGLAYTVCRLTANAYCSTALPVLLCNAGSCKGFPLVCK